MGMIQKKNNYMHVPFDTDDMHFEGLTGQTGFSEMENLLNEKG